MDPGAWWLQPGPGEQKSRRGADILLEAVEEEALPCLAQLLGAPPFPD